MRHSPAAFDTERTPDMKLATIRTAAGNRAVPLDGNVLVDLGVADLGALLADPHWRETAAAA